MSAEWTDAAEAGDRLGVDPRQVRRLAARGEIAAQRVGRAWLIDADALRDRAARGRRGGRPPSAATAWRILAVVGAALDGDGASVSAVPQSWDRRIRHRVRKMIAEGPDPTVWSSWLRRRGEVRRLWAHPGVASRLLADERVRHHDVAGLLGLGRGVPGRLYVAASELPALLADHRAHFADDGDLIVVAVPELPADVEPHVDRGLEAAAVVDLLESRDARAHQAVARALSAAVARLADTSFGEGVES